MAQTNPFVQFSGHLQSVAGELTRRLGERGGNIVESIGKLAQPANAWALDELTATLAKLANIFRVKIGGLRTAAQVLEASGYTGYDRSIGERCVLSQGSEKVVNIEVFDIEHFDHDPTDAEVEAEYVRRGPKRPTPDHAIHFGEQHQHLPVEGHPVIFYLEKPVEFPGAGGFRYVFYLWRNGALRELDWFWLNPSDRWNRNYRFAGVRE